MKRRGFLQLLGLSAVAPEVLKAKENEFDHAWGGQWTNSGVGPRISPKEWERQYEQVFSVTGPSSPTDNALARFSGIKSTKEDLQ